MKLNPSPTNKQGQPYCSIQVTTENGALCIINPLFLHEHGDKWLTQFSEMKRNTVQLYCDQKPAINHAAKGHERGSKTEEQVDTVARLNIADDHFDPKPSEETPKASYEIQEPSETGESAESSNMSGIRLSRRALKLSNRGSHMPNQANSKHKKGSSLLSHRVSWIEPDQPAEASLQKSNSETSLYSADSLLLPPLPELDSVSVSSIEEEVDCHSLPSKRKHSHALGNIVRHSLLAVSNVLTGLVSPEKHLGNRIQQLAEDQLTYLGATVQTFICNIHKGHGQHQSSTAMLQAIRQLLTDLKAFLLENNEFCEVLEHQDIDESKIACIIETSLYKCVLKPVRSVIYSQLLDFHTKDGSLTKLLENQQKMKSGDLREQKPKADLPGPATMEKIKQKLSLIHMSYSPEKMIALLLKVCKLIYESMEASSGKKAFGADDFLPVLIHVLIDCDLTSLQLDVEYMMELLDPSQLQGEGGYYLTTMFGALYHISSYNTVSRHLSVEAQNSIRQWQRRRTIHRKHTIGRRTKRISTELPNPKHYTILKCKDEEDSSSV
ncbi:ras and Rab interactor 3-like isoform X2 [Spea bombifrons]|uniref:ras and Rab interactor 3-like isoform X2 n=1 Tax=Spea bombifrons TaxID=233779 RepID=UPI00234B949A|nr:ras and Rab interactor 3-like isoform X2 [Spea bombifrons]